MAKHCEQLPRPASGLAKCDSGGAAEVVWHGLTLPASLLDLSKWVHDASQWRAMLGVIFWQHAAHWALVL